MLKIFDSIYSNNLQNVSSAMQSTNALNISSFLIMVGIALVSGFLYSWIISFKMRASRRMFSVIAILPAVVGSIITFVNGNIGAGVAIGGAFALIRFRSAQGTSDELVAIFTAMTSGVAFGMGFCGYGMLVLILFGVVYVMISNINIFEHKTNNQEFTLRITIPETLGSMYEFDDIFKTYLASWQYMGVRTVGMGSMYKVSFKIVLKEHSFEKKMIDEIRIRNGNLEISITPFEDEIKGL